MQEDYKCMRLSHRANILVSAINLRQNGRASKILFISESSSSSSVLFLGTLEELELADAEAPIPPDLEPSRCLSLPTAMAAAPWSQSKDEASSSQD